MFSPKLIRIVFLIAFVAMILFGASVVFAIEPVSQGPGTVSYRPWKTTLTDATGVPLQTPIGTPFFGSGAPAARVAVSSVSAAATGLTASATYRVACDVPVFFRVGSGTPTAVTTDALFLAGIEYLGLRSADTAIAFVTTTGTGVCTVTRLYVAP